MRRDDRVRLAVHQPVAEVYADIDRAISDGLLDNPSGDLRALIGRPTTPLARAVADALARLPG